MVKVMTMTTKMAMVMMMMVMMMVMIVMIVNYDMFWVAGPGPLGLGPWPKSCLHRRGPGRRHVSRESLCTETPALSASHERLLQRHSGRQAREESRGATIP